MTAATSNIKYGEGVAEGGSLRPPLVLEEQKWDKSWAKAPGLKIPADGYTITQQSIWYLHTSLSSLCHCWPFCLSLLLHIPHFYQSKCIYYIILSLAYSKFLSPSTLKVFLVPLSYHWFFSPSSTVWLSQAYSFRGQLLWLAPRPAIWADASQGSFDSAGSLGLQQTHTNTFFFYSCITHECTIICFPSLLLMDIWVASHLWLLQNNTSVNNLIHMSSSM